MKKWEYFKINSIEELEKSYHMFEGEWLHSLETEIIYFNLGYRHIKYCSVGICLVPKEFTVRLVEIKPSFKTINNLNKLI